MKIKHKSILTVATALAFLLNSVPISAAPGGSSSSSVIYSGATTITSAATQSGKTYTSTTADQNALLISTSDAVTITSPTVTKSGDSDGGDNCNFYGINSGIMVKGGTATTITGGTVTATAKGANGVFSYGGNGGTNGAAGDGTTVTISGTTINTTGDNSGGIMTTGGGIMYASDLTITTTGQSSAPIRTDRGGGTVTVSGGNYTSQGLGSPAIYCTADITVSDATLVSQLSEGVCIEGQNSVTLTDCDLTATNTQCNGKATFYDTIMIYQSQSGDAASGTSSFTMTGGTLTSNNGHVFHVTNTDAVITLSGVTITNNDSDNILLSICDDGWSGSDNVATLSASGQTFEGKILVGSNSELTLNLSNSSVYTGTVSGSITNASGTSVSSSVGTVDVTLDSTSKWNLTADTYISSFSGSAANVIDNGYTLYVNGTALSGTTSGDDDEDEGDDEEGYIATFVTDGHATITVYNTQDTDSDGTENAVSAYARNSDTGEIDVSGDGQVNFKVVTDDGYTVSSVTASPSNYKNLKTVDAENFIYRITKITGDITVTVVTEETENESGDESGEGDGIIHLNGTSIDATGISGATVSGTTVTITAAGEYNIEGTLSDGQIAVAASDKSDIVVLNLDSVTVTSSTGNPINATKGSVTIANSGTSTFTATADSAVAIYSKNDLTIKGEGTLNAVSSSGNGIRCKADLEIGAGDINVTAGNHGIKGDESIKFTKKAGTITVNATGDAIKTDAIDSDTLELDTDSSYNPKGTITINGGTFNLTADGDGFQADYGFISANSPIITINSGTEGIKVNTTPVDAWYYTDDTSTTTATIQGYIQIDGGTFNITSGEDGIKAADYVNVTDGTITIVSALNGIQAGVDYTDANGDTAYTNGNLTITGGTFDIKTNGGSSGKSTENSCKGIKAINDLSISGGDFTLNCYDDAIHSNYNVTITGGTYEIATSDDGVHADYWLTMGNENGADDDYTMNISTCYEGLEGSVIEYLSGTTTLYATDDGVNAAGDYEENGTYHASNTSNTNTMTLFAGPGGGGQQGGGQPGNPGGGNGGPNQGMDDTSDYGMLYIKGGNLYVVAKGDGLDSNGSILMSDGVVVVNGTTTSGGNGVFDKGDSSGSYFKVTGGTLVGFGTTDMQDNPTVSGQSYLSTTTSLIKGSTKNVLLATNTYLGIVPEITLSNALLFVTTPDMTSSRSVYSGTVSYSDSNKLLGRTVSNTWYGVYKSDYDNSSDDETEKVATPTASVSSGSVTSGTNVYLTTTTSGATIYYTTNGSTPTTSSTVYSSGISITSATTIKAIAVKSGMTSSDMLTVSYTIKSSGGGSGSSSSGSSSSSSSGTGSSGTSSGNSSSSSASSGSSNSSSNNTDTSTTDNDEKNGMFNDVKQDEWYYDAVKYMREKGFMKGTSDNDFSPEMPLTRAMFITVLYRAENEPAINIRNTFSDVKEDEYYFDAVSWAKENNIINGVTDTKFAPDNTITREQIAAIIYRYANYKKYDTVQSDMSIREYSDYYNISEYAYSAMEYAVASGLIKGKTDTTLNPTDTATRAEIAAILQRFFESNE